MSSERAAPSLTVSVSDATVLQADQLFRVIFDNASVCIALANLGGYVLEANQADCEFLGYPHHELVGMHFSKFTHPDDMALDQHLFQDLIEGRRDNYVIEKRYLRKDKKVVWGRLTVSLVPNTPANLSYIMIICEDITQVKQIEQAHLQSQEDLRQSEITYRMLFTSNPHPLWVYDLETLGFLEVNDAALVKYGYSRDEFLTMTMADLRPTESHPHLYTDLSEGGDELDTAGIWKHRKKDGTLIDVEIISHSLLFRGHRAELVLAQDISDRLQSEAKLRYTTLHDGLTDLPNRYLLTQKLQTAIKQSQRHNKPRHVVLFLDLDRFKAINDSLGHLVGDQMLVIMASKLKSLVRETDLVARLGGDEFVVLLEDDEPIRGAIRIAERLLKELQQPLSVGDREVFLSTSIGIVLITPLYNRTADLLRDADIAMYRAKSKGKGRYEIFDAEMHAYALQRLTLESDLHKALERNELTVYFQPIVALKSLQLVGLEALVRWQHPRRGLVGPTEFISIAEEIGLIIAIDRWVLQAVCQQMALWSQHPATAHLRISVNLSVQDLWNIHLLDEIDTMLATHGLTGRHLALEITESMLVQDMDTTTKLINQLRQRGIHISIDDFGTGYSSLSYLHQLPADTLKIDRSFVSEMQQNPKHHKIVETILALGHHLDLKVTAEGVETQAQHEALKRLGCEYGQGSWFAPPLPAAAAATYALHHALT